MLPNGWSVSVTPMWEGILPTTTISNYSLLAVAVLEHRAIHALQRPEGTHHQPKIMITSAHPCVRVWTGGGGHWEGMCTNPHGANDTKQCHYTCMYAFNALANVYANYNLVYAPLKPWDHAYISLFRSCLAIRTDTHHLTIYRKAALSLSLSLSLSISNQLMLSKLLSVALINKIKQQRSSLTANPLDVVYPLASAW